jgi:hypothetical protein
MRLRTRRRNNVRRWGAIAVGACGLGWYLRKWQSVTDVACARLSESLPFEPALVDGISPAQLQRDTEALCAIQPRNSGTPGEVKARKWVAVRFREAGLQRVRLDPVLYPRWIGEQARLTLLSTPPVELPCLALAGSAATPPAGLRAPLLDVGSGQADDYARLVRAQTQARVHLAWGGSLHRRDICLSARKSGAVGVIVAHPDPHAVESDSGQSHLVEAGTSVVLGRLPTLAVSNPVGQRLREAVASGVPVQLSVNRRYTLGVGYNVVGELTGLTSEYVALVAHHDAWYSGAADNAAGVAALLELARAWGNAATGVIRPKRAIRFVSTAAEEEGLMGALGDVVLRGIHVKARCRGVVSLDVVGAPRESLWATGWPPQLCGAALAIARGLGYEAQTGSSLGIYEGRAYGDHWPYTLLRIPGVMLAKFPYRYYHTPYDTPDRLDYEDARLHAVIGGTLAWRLACR